jgi:hypothetical protein
MDGTMLAKEKNLSLPMALHNYRHSGCRAERGGPESMNTGLWKMDSGLATCGVAPE